MKSLIIMLSLIISQIVNAKITNNEPIWPKLPSSVYVNFSMDRLAAILLMCEGIQELQLSIGLPPRVTRNFKAGSIEDLTFTFTDHNGKSSKHILMFLVGEYNLLYQRSAVPALLNSVQMMKKYAYLNISYQWFKQDFALNSSDINAFEKSCFTSKRKKLGN